MFGYLTIMWVYYSLWHYYPMGNVMFLPYHTDVLSINTSVFTPDSISLWWRNVTNQSSAWEGLYSAQCSAESCRTYFIPAWTGRFIELAASPSLLLPLPLHIFLIRLNDQHAQRQRCVCVLSTQSKMLACTEMITMCLQSAKRKHLLAQQQPLQITGQGLPIFHDVS